MPETSSRVSVAAGLGVFLLAAAWPLYWVAVSSFTPEARLFESPALVPRALTLDHYRAIFVERDFWVPIRNSIVVSTATTALALGVGAPCAYALARLRLPGTPVILATILAVSMFPQVAIISPLFLVLRTVGLIDTYTGLVLPYLTFSTPLTVWFLVGFFRQLPRELEEAAVMDGASRFRAFREIALPLAWPGLATAGVLAFLYSWNEFLFALSFTLGPERQTVPVAIALFRGQYQVSWGQVLAASLVATVPVAVVVLVAQRRIVQGLTLGGVKG